MSHSEADKLASVSSTRVPDRIVEPPIVDHVAQEVAQIVAWLRAEAPASSARMAMLWAAEAIERREYRPKRGPFWPFEERT